MLTLEIDPREYLAAGERFVSALADSSETVLRSVAGAAVVELAAVTPPGSLGVRGVRASVLGEQMVKGDAYGVVLPVSGPGSGESAEVVIRRHRGRDGRTRRPVKKIPVNAGDLARYFRKELPRVGYTMSGWKPAALALGRTLDPIAMRNSGPGSIRFDRVGDVVTIEFSNDVPWFGQMEGVQARMDRVLAKYEGPLRDYLERAAAEAVARSGLG